jgi:AraC family transcriptional regulator of adaptative response / DNA-3-methyladenine glycosylase II
MFDDDTCYRAFTSRDRRFDGRFVTAVLTTGIYCRPGCPARRGSCAGSRWDLARAAARRHARARRPPRSEPHPGTMRSS